MRCIESARKGTHLARLLALLLLPIGLATACSVDVPRISLRPELAEEAMPSGGSLGVLPFRDHRAEAERKGKKPTLWVLLFYNWRRGDWMTSDAAFEEDVAAVVTEGAVRALSSSRFGGARLLEAAASDDAAAADDPDTAPSGWSIAGLDRRRCDEPGIRYLAGGSIESLYGTLRQKFELLIIPMPFVSISLWGNAKSDAVGVASVDIAVFDCEKSKVVYQRSLTSSRRYPEITISEAAKLALEDALERLRNETR